MAAAVREFGGGDRESSQSDIRRFVCDRAAGDDDAATRSLDALIEAGLLDAERLYCSGVSSTR